MEFKQTPIERLINELEKWGAGRIHWPHHIWEEAEQYEKEYFFKTNIIDRVTINFKAEDEPSLTMLEKDLFKKIMKKML